MKLMTWHRTFGVLGALAFAASVVVSGQAPGGGQAPAGGQQAPGGQAAGQGRGAAGDSTVIMVGENPAITHRNPPAATAAPAPTAPPAGGGRGRGNQGPTISNANFWRASWTPVGPGAACFITVNEPTPAAQKFVITDSPQLARYIITDVLGRLMQNFNTPPWTIMQGSVTQTNDGAKARTETCRSGNMTVELKWTGLGQATWSEPGMRVNMTMISVRAEAAEIVINGKRAPGSVSTGFLALNETWRIDAASPPAVP